LVRILTNKLLDHLGELGGIGEHIGFVVAGADQRNSGLEVNAILPNHGIPDGEGRHYGGVCLEGDSGNAAGSAREQAKKVHEHALGRSHILVHEDADGFATSNGGDQTTCEILLGEGLVAVKHATIAYQPIEIGIIKRTNHHPHAVAVERVGERTNLPSAEVASQEEHAFSASARRIVALEALIDGKLLYVLLIVRRELTEVGKLAAQDRKST